MQKLAWRNQALAEILWLKFYVYVGSVVRKSNKFEKRDFSRMPRVGWVQIPEFSTSETTRLMVCNFKASFGVIYG